MENEQEATVVVGAAESDLENPHFELQIYTAGGSELRVPLARSEFLIDSSLNSPIRDAGTWELRLREDRLIIQRVGAGPDLLFRGDFCSQATLDAGDNLELAGHRIWMVDARQPPLATLEAYSGEFLGRQWPLQRQQYCLGRRGSRQNQVEINHPTISRAQATLMPDLHGQFQLLVEATSSPTLLNGKKMSGGGCQMLHHGDLLQFGELLFRFRDVGSSATGGKLLNLHTLGRFEVVFGSQSFPEAAWKVEKSKWLLGRLGLDWNVPSPVETIMEQFWPDLPSLRGRKNLSQCVTAIRTTLGLPSDGEGDADLFARSNNTLQIHSRFLGDHDYMQVISLLGQRSEPLNPAPLEKAMELYQGPFLPGCYEDWAVNARDHLEGQMIHSGCTLAAHHLSKGKAEPALQAAQKVLQWDPCCQEAAETAMEALVTLGRAQEAVRLFEVCKQRLRTQLDLEPSTSLLRLYHKARLEM